MIYIVTWVLIKTIPVGCPVEKPATDQYGRTSNLSIVHAVACSHRQVDTLMKTFKNRKDAVDFYEGAKKELPSKGTMISDGIEFVKIDSIK